MRFRSAFGVVVPLVTAACGRNVAGPPPAPLIGDVEFYASQSFEPRRGVERTSGLIGRYNVQADTISMVSLTGRACTPAVPPAPRAFVYECGAGYSLVVDRAHPTTRAGLLKGTSRSLSALSELEDVMEEAPVTFTIRPIP